MASKKTRSRKETLAEDLESLFAEYQKLFIVTVDNVTSNQLHEIRKSLRGDAIIYCGKNTQMRRVIKKLEEQGREDLEKVRLALKDNVALVFTNGNTSELRTRISENKMPAAAKAGALAQTDVHIQKGMTQLEPTQTSFLQALNISTKITKGNIEILNDYQVCTAGVKVDPSTAALLGKLGVMPFAYGLEVIAVMEGGSLFHPSVLDITNDQILAAFRSGVKNVAAVCIEMGTPTMVSVPYSILIGFSNLLAVAAETEFTFKEAEEIKKYLEDPSAFACAAPVAQATAGQAAPVAAAADDDDDDDDDAAAPGGGLFDDDGDDY